MIADQDLRPGTRVRIVAPSGVLHLRSATGTIARKDIWQDYYIVRLDKPALSCDTPGAPEDLPEIREHIENLEVLRQS